MISFLLSFFFIIKENKKESKKERKKENHEKARGAKANILLYEKALSFSAYSSLSGKAF